MYLILQSIVRQSWTEIPTPSPKQWEFEAPMNPSFDSSKPEVKISMSKVVLRNE